MSKSEKYKNATFEEKLKDTVKFRFGPKMSEKIFRLHKYLFYEKNPLGPISYVVLTVLGVLAAIELNFRKPFLPGPYLPFWHVYTTIGCLMVGYITFILAYFSSSG